MHVACTFTKVYACVHVPSRYAKKTIEEEKNEEKNTNLRSHVHVMYSY